MASFDIMTATGRGYKFLWQQRGLIARLAALPVLIKFISFTTVVSLGLEGNILRQGLVLFPSYLIEGYLICALVRIAIYPQEELVQPPGSGAYEYYKQRGRDIQAGAVLYTLIKLFMMFMVGMALASLPEKQELMAAAQTQEETSPAALVSGIIGFIIMLWAFRFAWLNIPITLGYSMSEYVKKIKGMSFSFHIFSVWFMSMIPFGLFIILCSDIFSVVTMHTSESPSDVYRFLMLSVQSVIETCMNIVSSVAIGYGIFWILTGQNFMPKKKDDDER